MKDMMRAHSLLPPLFLVIALIGCTRGPGPTTPTELPDVVPTMIEHILQVNGLRLRFAYPEGWSVETGGGEVFDVHIFGLVDGLVAVPPTQSDGSVFITVLDKHESELGDTLEDFAQRTKRLNLRGLHGNVSSASEINVVTLGELDGLSFTLDYPSELDATIIRRARFEVADLGSHWLTLRYGAKADLFEKYQPIFDAIGASFKVERSS